MSRIFISYSRESHEIARSLVAHIHELGYVVWMDKDLSGGQAWWDQILSSHCAGRIRSGNEYLVFRRFQ